MNMSGSPGRWLWTDINNPPKRTEEMIEQGQVWVWLSGPGGGHFEVRGTGLRLDD